MEDENSAALGLRAAKLIKDGNFSLDVWSDIIEGITSEPLASLVVAIRNALSYGRETGAIRGIVRAGYTKALSDWDSMRKGVSPDILEAGDKAIKEAEVFIKREKIRIE